MSKSQLVYFFVFCVSLYSVSCTPTPSSKNGEIDNSHFLKKQVFFEFGSFSFSDSSIRVMPMKDKLPPEDSFIYVHHTFRKVHFDSLHKALEEYHRLPANVVFYYQLYSDAEIAGQDTSSLRLSLDSVGAFAVDSELGSTDCIQRQIFKRDSTGKFDRVDSLCYVYSSSSCWLPIAHMNSLLDKRKHSKKAFFIWQEAAVDTYTKRYPPDGEKFINTYRHFYDYSPHLETFRPSVLEND